MKKGRKDMKELDLIIEAIVKEGQSWSGETPKDKWYRDRIRPFVEAAFKLGSKDKKK